MILGYNTNGFANHDCIDAVRVLAEIGYQSIALTVDHHCLNPLAKNSQIADLKRVLQDFDLGSVIETGARYLLDPFCKHEPTLLSPNPEKRIDFYKHCIDVASELGSDCVSIWSGILRESWDDEKTLEHLADGLRSTLKVAEAADVIVAFEPEPGMFIDTTSSYERLKEWVDSPNLKMTMDVGHLYCLHEVPITDYLHRFASEIVNIHIEDMKAGVHEHLMFGEGDMSFPPIIDALHAIKFDGGVHVELSRHSHDAPRIAQQAFDFLQPLLTAHSADLSQ